jgi:CRISPR-associated protein (TIGR03985 family)
MRFLPTPQILQWLAAGQLANRFLRSIRLWVLVDKLYGKNWAEFLPQPFTYSQLRDSNREYGLFSSYHPHSEKLTGEEIIANCHDQNCLCYQTANNLIFTRYSPGDRITTPLEYRLQWVREISQMTGFDDNEIQKLLHACPFATVHRSLRDDLKQLVSLGWLQEAGKGKYRCVEREYLPVIAEQHRNHTPQESLNRLGDCVERSARSDRNLSEFNFSHLDISQVWELLRALESIAFVQPNLSTIINSLWEQISDRSSTSSLLLEDEPQQRIFLHLDYIVSRSMQDRVDTYQEQLESLWHKPPGGMVRFNYWVANTEKKVSVTVYPVCLHYLRRAKYLSAYGIDPDGNLAWHNYRLDRIASKRLKILPWDDPSVHKELKDMWHAGELPTPEYISQELAAAWGFNFYLPKQLLILRFSSHFAKWYVDDTFRHQTFRTVKYRELPEIIRDNIGNKTEQKQILKILQKSSPDDVYYTAWIRAGDINVLMRLRDWRPNGEAIAPLSIREQLAVEAKQELANYEHSS